MAELDTQETVGRTGEPEAAHGAREITERSTGSGAKGESGAHAAAGRAAVDRIAGEERVLSRSAAQLLAGTVEQLASFAGDQADWPTRIPIADGDGRKIWRLLELLFRQPGLVAACGEMVVSSLLQAGVPGAHQESMLRYARGVTRAYETAELKPVADPILAIAMGDALHRLEAGIVGSVLKEICREGGFETLVYQKLVDAFVDYVRVVRPLLTASNGMEIESFARFFKETGGKPTRFVGRLKHVRNHHHFTAEALEQLAQNETDFSRSRPLTLVLHSAQDHNGAFHRDPAMDAVIMDRRNLTILVEGCADLASATALVPVLAASYGQGGKIDQVMIAGHGDARAMQQGADRDAQNTLSQENLALDDNLIATDRLLNTLLDNMDEHGPHRRILLNACLTASNYVPGNVALDADPEAARKQVLGLLAKNESLANHVQALIGKRSIVALGANASIGSVQMIDPSTGGLTLQSKDDPAVTASKLEYARVGVEPIGAVRAAVECWAKSPAAARPVIEARAKLVPEDWNAHVIRAHYELILNNWDNPGAVAVFDTSVEPWAELEFEGAVTPQWLVNAGWAETREYVASRVAHDPSWKGEVPHMALVGLQGLLDTANKTAHAAALVAHVGKRFTALGAERFVEEAVVSTGYASLLTNPANPAPGSLVIALVGVHHGSKPCLDYLRRVRGGGTRFPSALALSTRIGGLYSEQQLIDKLDGAAPKTVRNNIDLDGDGRNDMRVTPTAMTMQTVDVVFVLARPAADSLQRDSLVPGSLVHVIGDAGLYWAIEWQGSTAFIAKSPTLKAVGDEP